jgi:hypothetical protein
LGARFHTGREDHWEGVSGGARRRRLMQRTTTPVNRGRPGSSRPRFGKARPKQGSHDGTENYPRPAESASTVLAAAASLLAGGGQIIEWGLPVDVIDDGMLSCMTGDE